MKYYLTITLLLATLFIGVFPAFAAEEKPDLTYLTMINRTDGQVSIQLSGENYYYLTVAPGTTKTFHVEKGVYDHNTSSCGLNASGMLDVSSRVRLTFVTCVREAANQGEPGLEKVSMYNYPYSPYFHYRYQE
jgi:hypothetical protein